MNEKTELDTMYETQMDLLKKLQTYKDRDSFNVINQHMKTICKELNTMRINEITGEIAQNGN